MARHVTDFFGNELVIATSAALELVGVEVHSVLGTGAGTDDPACMVALDLEHLDELIAGLREARDELVDRPEGRDDQRVQRASCGWVNR
jgi:hypothetical protein